MQDLHYRSQTYSHFFYKSSLEIEQSQAQLVEPYQSRISTSANPRTISYSERHRQIQRPYINDLYYYYKPETTPHPSSKSLFRKSVV